MRFVSAAEVDAALDFPSLIDALDAAGAALKSSLAEAFEAFDIDVGKIMGAVRARLDAALDADSAATALSIAEAQREIADRTAFLSTGKLPTEAALPRATVDLTFGDAPSAELVVLDPSRGARPLAAGGR